MSTGTLAHFKSTLSPSDLGERVCPTKITLLAACCSWFPKAHWLAEIEGECWLPRAHLGGHLIAIFLFVGRYRIILNIRIRTRGAQNHIALAREHTFYIA